MSSQTQDALSTERENMTRQIELRGLQDPRLLAAFREVPREAFLPPELAEFAYRDSPLPIGNEQTISQPFIVALMTAAAALKDQDRVLEIGTGSGYAAAILSRLAGEVYTVERYQELAESARRSLREHGFRNVHVRQGDGTLGWPEQAPYDAIVVAAGGPQIPQPLRDQLRIGGRLVIPLGENRNLQKLVCFTKTAEDRYEEEDLGDVRFVPLVGTAGWEDEDPPWDEPKAQKTSPPKPVSQRIAEAAEPFAAIEDVDLTRLLERIGDCRLVLIGEATHGTSEFYRMRAKITQALIEQQGFDFVAIEADWPDAARIHRYVTSPEPDTTPPDWQAFARFPTWMWRNQEVLDFIEWLRAHNRQTTNPVGFFGLDLYSMHTSIAEVLAYLDDIDPETARLARHRYGCLSPWEKDPATYGRAALTGKYQTCERDVVQMLQELMQQRSNYIARDGEQFFDAAQNAQLVADAEQYYRRMYYGGNEAWNLRDTHMHQTLQAILRNRGPQARGILWEHNSHLGNATATAMGQQGELNVGQLCKEEWGDSAYLIGQGTDRGTVVAAPNWDAPHQRMQVRPSQKGSYEHLCQASGLSRFMLPLRGADAALRQDLAGPLLERAIGVVYRPQTEMQSHYFHASLPDQFDEWIWFQESQGVDAIEDEKAREYILPHPFSVID